jgi:hypothetical protein
LAGAGTVYCHYGFNGWNPTISPDPAMSYNSIDEVWEITVPVQSSASQLDVVFTDGNNTWDNNGGADWHFTVTGGGPVEGWQMDGVLDGDAQLVAQNAGLHLYAGLKGSVLYVATEDAGEGNDHFILMADSPGALQSAMWAKAGQVAAWDAFLADENDNDYVGWFDAIGSVDSATGPNGGVLEGTINLAEELGSLPADVHLSVALYGTSNGGALLSSNQVPATINSDGNVDAGEYVVFPICQGPAVGPDLDGDCDVDVADATVFVDCLTGAGNAITDPNCLNADFDGDMDADLVDFSSLQLCMSGSGEAPDPGCAD